MKWLNQAVAAFRKLKNDRLYRRQSAELIAVKIFLREQAVPQLEQIVNWSPGGILIMTKEVLPLETLLNMEFPLGKEGSLIQLKGQVVRHQTNHETGAVEGMGIMFTDFTQSGLLVLRDLLLNSSENYSNKI